MNCSDGKNEKSTQNAQETIVFAVQCEYREFMINCLVVCTTLTFPGNRLRCEENGK